MSALEEIRRRFQEDHFATDAAGAQIDCAEPGRAVCSLTLEEKHMNGIGVPMGGAVLRWRILPVRLPPTDTARRQR